MTLDHLMSEEGRRCAACHHSPLKHFNWWNTTVANPIRDHGYKGVGLAAVRMLKVRLFLLLFFCVCLQVW